MMPRGSRTPAIAGLLVALASAAPAWGRTPAEADLAVVAEAPQLFREQCRACHEQAKAEGGCDVDDLLAGKTVASNVAGWRAVLERLVARDMPPEDAKRRPTEAEYQNAETWLREQLVRQEAFSPAQQPRPMRRLNAAEFDRTVREVFGIPAISLSESFPPDDAFAGFTNIAEALSLSAVGQSLDLGNPQAAAANFKDRIRLMLDVLVLALQTDQTRVATATLGYMGDVSKEEGLHDTYHGYTHTGPAGMAKVDRLRMEHVAYFLERLQAVREADGSTLLDNSLVRFGGGMGTWHESTDLPNLVAGHAGGRFKLGEHVVYDGKPLANLYVTMLQAAGIDVDRFADSTAPLPLS